MDGLLLHNGRHQPNASRMLDFFFPLLFGILHSLSLLPQVASFFFFPCSAFGVFVAFLWSPSSIVSVSLCLSLYGSLPGPALNTILLLNRTFPLDGSRSVLSYAWIPDGACPSLPATDRVSLLPSLISPLIIPIPFLFCSCSILSIRPTHSFHSPHSIDTVPSRLVDQLCCSVISQPFWLWPGRARLARLHARLLQVRKLHRLLCR